jgi:hypothetical protein
MNSDPLALLARMPSGTALCLRKQMGGGSEEIAWLIREGSARLAELGPSPEIELRAGILEEGPIVLVPVLVRVGSSAEESVYETWINHYAEEGGVLETLADQGRLAVHLYGDGCEYVGTLVVRNQLQWFCRQALSRIAAAAHPWTMPQFDRARDKVYRRYPCVWDFWRALAALPSRPDETDASAKKPRAGRRKQ